MEAAALVAERAATFGGFLATLTAIGVCTARWAFAGLPTARLAGLGTWAAAALLVAQAVRLWGHTVSIVGDGNAPAWAALDLVARQSAWGGGWRPQVSAAALLLPAFLWCRTRPAFGWPAATLATAGIVATIPLLGHAAGEPVLMTVHVAHVLGAGVWLGTLAALVSVRGLSAIQLASFSRMALPAAALVAGSGAWAAWTYVGTWTPLLSTPYGRWLTAKLVLVAGIVTCGAVNWQRHARGTGSGGGVAVSPAIVATELILAVLTLVATSILTELEHPGP